MSAVEQRAIEARIGLHKLCISAGISGTIASRWTREGKAPSLPTIGKLEKQLEGMDA